MIRSFEAAAPAKVNLGLRVTGRRPDGYHELDSLFAPLDLADALTLTVHEASSAQVALRLDPPADAVPAGPDNLAARAARAFLEEAALPLSVEIALRKQIPVGAGLGGGSSDAGTVLRLLATGWPEAIPGARLAELALSLGADVPYFLDPRPARVSGIGEQVAPLPELPRLELLLANPGVVLPTAEVYRAFAALVPEPGIGGPPPRLPLRLPMPEGLELALDNDLEGAALHLCPALRRLRERLEATGPLAVGMSGSGPTLFGVFATRAEAEHASGRTWDPASGPGSRRRSNPDNLAAPRDPRGVGREPGASSLSRRSARRTGRI